MEAFEQAFQPHHFKPPKNLYHVYDNLSRTPYIPGIGIECEDNDVYWMYAWHVIKPSAIREHLDWGNRRPTQFISLYDDPTAAMNEQQRRQRQTFVPGAGIRDPNSVRVAHVRLSPNTNVWAFSRAELLKMMACFGGEAQWDIHAMAGAHEWFVWGDIPNECVFSVT